MSTIKIRLALGLTAAVTILSLACSGNAPPSAVETKAKDSAGQQEAIDGGPVSIPVPEAKLSGDSVEADTSNMTASPSSSDETTPADASPEPQPQALTSTASGGNTQMEQNPVLEGAIPSVAAPVVIEASLPVNQIAGTLGDLSDVLEVEPQVVDITSTTATVIATTTIEMACAVAYGKTTDYGRLATDLNMAGGGHANHHPQLFGLEPDTEYHLTFGGVGPDGTVYGYKDLTFRTKPAGTEAESRSQDKNLALAKNGGRVTRVSSNYGSPSMDSSFGANNALDGNPSTQWSSQGDGNGAWIEIELAQDSHVTSLGFWTRTMGTSAQIASFRVVTDQGETFGPFDLADASAVHYFDVDLTAKRLRFETVDSSGGNTGAVEIEVYGEPAR